MKEAHAAREKKKRLPDRSMTLPAALPEKKSVGRGMRGTAAPDRIVWRSFFYD